MQDEFFSLYGGENVRDGGENILGEFNSQVKLREPIVEDLFCRCGLLVELYPTLFINFSEHSFSGHPNAGHDSLQASASGFLHAIFFFLVIFSF